MSNPARILMCRPEHFGIHYQINPWMNVAVGADSELARGQWERLRATLASLGASIEMIDPVEGLPDQVFTANAGLVYERKVILSRFRHGVRQGEEPYFAAWFRQHGFDVTEVPGGLYFEGAGDALFCGDTLFSGYRYRTDAGSHSWISQSLGVEVLPLELVDPRFYHLDTCFCPIEPGTAIYYPGAFDDYGRAVLRARVNRLVEARPEEATTFCCNAVAVGRTVVMNEGAPHLAADLEALGFAVKTTPLGEFLKSGGSAKCLTLRLDGEEAATWRLAATGE